MTASERAEIPPFYYLTDFFLKPILTGMKAAGGKRAMARWNLVRNEPEHMDSYESCGCTRNELRPIV